MKERMEGLGRRLIAYAVLVVAVIVVLRVVLGAVMGFVHMLFLIALLVFAIYAISWAMRFKNSS
jgi:hypothetical protein